MGNGSLISTWKHGIEFQRMKAFSGLQLEKDVDYSSIENCVGAVTLLQLEEIPTSLLDKGKRIT